MVDILLLQVDRDSILFRYERIKIVFGRILLFCRFLFVIFLNICTISWRGIYVERIAINQEITANMLHEKCCLISYSKNVA